MRALVHITEAIARKDKTSTRNVRALVHTTKAIGGGGDKPSTRNVRVLDHKPWRQCEERQTFTHCDSISLYTIEAMGGKTRLLRAM